MGYATAPPDSTLAAWPYLQGGKATGHAHAHAHTLMPHTQRSYPPDGSSHGPPQGLKKKAREGTLKDHKDKKKGPREEHSRTTKTKTKKKAALNPKTKKPFLQGDDL